MIKSLSPKENGLLGALSEEKYAELLPDLEHVKLPARHVIYESGDRLSHIYFPTSGFISKLYITESGSSTEIAMTGYDGLVGVALFMGGDTTPTKTVVASEGEGYRLKAEIAKREFRAGGEFQKLVLHYIQALTTEMSQTAVCNRHHSLDQRLCRLLLLSLDRLPSNEVCMTQELISNMLGVRREGVTEAAGNLQNAGIISYSRGHITILDRPLLEERVCECYSVVQHEFGRLLPYFYDKISTVI